MGATLAASAEDSSSGPSAGLEEGGAMIVRRGVNESTGEVGAELLR